MARFTKNVPRAKVVRVESVMRPTTDADSAGTLSVQLNDRVADVASIIVESDGPIAVREDDDTIAGYVDRDRFVRLLAGAAG